MDDVLKFLDGQIANKRLELERLEKARAVVSSPSVASADGPRLALPVAAVTTTPPAEPTAGDKPKNRGGRPKGLKNLGNGSGPQKKYCGPEIQAARDSLAALIQRHGPLTNKRLAELSKLPKWKVQAALTGWNAVAKTGPGLRDPWQLKPGYVGPNDPAIAASAGPTG